MANDDLFEDNDVIIDDIPKEETVIESNESGVVSDSQLSQVLSKVMEKLNNVNQFSFSIFSAIYQDFMTIPKSILSNYYNDSCVTNIAIYKSTLGSHDADTLVYLYELQRKILIMGFRHQYAFSLLQLFNENIEDEPEDSFLLYFQNTLQKEVILNELYLGKLLYTYEEYCELNDITVDLILVEHQLKSYMSSVEKREYGVVLKAKEIEDIGVLDNFVDHRDQMIREVNESVFRFINQVQSTIDKLKIEAGR
jgi:hypothetical protein